MPVDLGYNIINKAKMVRGRRQKRILRKLFESSIVRIAILGLITPIKMAKNIRRGLGWPQTIKWPPFLQNTPHNLIQHWILALETP
jgi:hypothetical protein